MFFKVWQLNLYFFRILYLNLFPHDKARIEAASKDIEGGKKGIEEKEILFFIYEK